jgi:hypothetical protein
VTVSESAGIIVLFSVLGLFSFPSGKELSYHCVLPVHFSSSFLVLFIPISFAAISLQILSKSFVVVDFYLLSNTVLNIILDSSSLLSVVVFHRPAFGKLSLKMFCQPPSSPVIKM